MLERLWLDPLNTSKRENAMNAASACPAIVFIHGFLDGAAVWSDVVDALGDRVESTLSLDLPGMGSRAKERGPFSLDRFAEDVARQVAELDRPVVLVGQSMGAQVAELAAERVPEQVQGLVLLTPVPLRGTHLPEEAIQIFRSLGSNPALQRQARKQNSVDISPEKLEKLGRLGDLVQPLSAAKLADLWNRGHPLGEGRTIFKGPVLLVRGEGDPFVTAEVVSTGVAPRFPDAKQATIAKAGHWVNVEQPVAFAKLLGDFVATIAAKDGAAAQGWTRAFEQKSSSAFSDAFAPDIVLEASAMDKPAIGVDQVRTVMAAASLLYESLEFKREVIDGSRTYLEWEVQAFGGEKIQGVTILERNDEGKIARVAIHHRPLGGALKFSAEMGRRLKGRVDDGMFYDAA